MRFSHIKSIRAAKKKLYKKYWDLWSQCPQVERKYNIDFSVKRDRMTQTPKCLVIFKGKDANVITQAFKEFVKENEKKKQRVSLRAKLKQFQKNNAQNNVM